MLASTKAFIKELDRKRIKYTDRGTLESGKDCITVSYTCKNMESLAIHFFFDKDCESVAVRAFDIVKLSAAQAGNMLVAINSQNARFRFVKFVLDTNDYTVQAEIDVPFRKHDVGEVCVEVMNRVLSICDDAYLELKKAL